MDSELKLQITSGTHRQKTLEAQDPFSALYTSDVGYVIPILRMKELEKLLPAPVCRAEKCQR